MPGKVIGNQLNFGYPGTISRGGDEVTTSAPVNSGSANIYFGDPVVMGTDGSVSKFGASNVAADFCGIAVRRVKSAVSYTVQSAYYAPYDYADILQRGPISVQVTEGTVAIKGTVYVCTGAGTTAKVGDIVATASPAGGGTTVALTNVRFGSAADANGVAELIILSRQGV